MTLPPGPQARGCNHLACITVCMYDGHAASRHPATRIRDVDNERLLVEAAKNDPKAFAPLYARYRPLVFAFCRRRLASPDAADDATAVVFARALAAITGVRGDAFAPWLFTIARRVVIDTYRARRPTDSLDERMAATMVDPDPSPEELAIAADERRRLYQLLTTLTPHQRAVIDLRIAGMTGAEIAQTLGLSLSAVKVHQFRAVARLQATQAAADRQEATSRHG